jgi:hypothetical protein
MLNKVKDSLFTRLLKRAGAAGALLSSRRVLVFTYDEMMNSELLEQLSIFPERSVLACAEDFAPRINVAGDQSGGFGRLGLAHELGEKVWGMVHEIAGAELLLLDGLLWSSGGRYQRRMIEITDRNGYEHKAWVFVAREPREDLAASRSYVEGLVQEGQRQGLPAHYLAQLSSLPSTGVAPLTLSTAKRPTEDGTFHDGTFTRLAQAAPSSGH